MDYASYFPSIGLFIFIFFYSKQYPIVTGGKGSHPEDLETLFDTEVIHMHFDHRPGHRPV